MGIFSCTNEQLGKFPKKHISQNNVVDYEKMTEILKNADKKENINLQSVGKSVEGRNIWLINITPVKLAKNPLKIFLFAQQHGNEPAGKDALIWLTKYLSDNINLMNGKIDLYLMPMVNPDGAEKNKRRNSNDADLNRDHLLLDQIETQILYTAYHKIKPHITIDCHEFNRTSQSFLEQGLEEWPQIMMGCGNSPLISDSFYKFGIKTVENLKKPMQYAGYNYCRYFVGGMPPEDENRYSTLESDDARNGMALLGSLSFIIESGIRRNAENPNADLGQRIDAYLHIFNYFINNEIFISETENLFAQERKSRDYLPVNYFWGKTESDIDSIMVLKDKEVVAINTANFMQTRIIKNNVKVPEKYLIPSQKCEIFKSLLKRHKIEYQILNQPEEYIVEPVKLLRIEKNFDKVYNRYGGRQITEQVEHKKMEFEKGSLIIKPKDNKYPLKVFYVLEPCNLFGLYRHEIFYNLIDDDILPVYRVVKQKLTGV